MAVPLGVAAANLTSHRAKAVIKPIIQTSPILKHIRVVNTGGELSHMYNQDYQLPTVSYIGLNQSAPNPTQGAQRQVNATVARMVIPMRIDNVFRSTPAKWETQEVMQMRLGGIAGGFQFNDDFFDGDDAVSPLKPRGMYKHMALGLTAGTIPSQQRINAGTGGATLTLAMLDELVDACQGENRILFMNQRLKRKILQLARDSSTSGIMRITESRDMFGKKLDEYDGIPIEVIQREDNYSTVLDFDEDDGSGNLDSASIWCISFGNETGVYSFAPQGLGFQVEPFVRVPGQPYWDSLSEWLFNYVVAGPRCIAQLNHVNNA